MAVPFVYQVRRFLPARLEAKLRGSKFVRRLAHRLVRGRPGLIGQGIGAGLRFNPGQSNPAFVFGTYEPPVQEALAAQLRPGDIFYDIGANVGFFTVIAARLVGDGGRVFAFEPVPRNLTVLRGNVERNGLPNVTIIAKAVSCRSGQGVLILTECAGGATLSSTIELPDATGKATVDLVSIDDLLASGEYPAPSLIKIDVEGAELEVLCGMSATLRSYHPSVLLEIDDGNELAFSERKETCETFLRGHGYSITQLPEAYPAMAWKVEHFLAVPELK